MLGSAGPQFAAEQLGSETFRRNHRVRYAYVAGAMYKGVASVAMVVRMGAAGFLSYFGSGGLRAERLEDAIRRIQSQLRDGEPYGLNLLCNPNHPGEEDDVVDLLLKYHVDHIEAAAYTHMTPSIVRYRCHGLVPNADGTIARRNKVLGKASRPEVAEAFLRPAPERILRALVDAGRISPEQMALAATVPVADDLCVEADSGGHTDQGVLLVLLPAIRALRDRLACERPECGSTTIGGAGGIGTPAAAAAAFVLGADFILSGSINQCTVESGTSEAVKQMLEQAEPQDTTLAPAGDMFEMGAKVQVLRKGTLFPARANKLFDVYQRHQALDEIEPNVREQIETKYFRRGFAEVWRETREFYGRYLPTEIDRAERLPRYKMALVFRWYFVESTRLAMNGTPGREVDYQVQCGPAMGAFNAFVKGTPLESWRNRHVDEIAMLIMTGAAAHLQERVAAISERKPALVQM